jgi:hypothetical protein
LSLATSISVVVACLLIFLPRRAESLTLGPLIHVHAVPQFARRYNVLLMDNSRKTKKDTVNVNTL